MVQCEMCGAETPSPKTVKVEGAELQVCDQCSDFGTEVRTDDSSSGSTKYSTSSSSSGGGGGGGGRSSSSSSSSGGGGRSRRQDMFDDMDELAADYDDRIRRAREDRGMSQSELADALNEKTSLIRKLERGDVLPSDKVQRELEGYLDIELSGPAGADEEEWSSGETAGSYTLGDMVERKD